MTLPESILAAVLLATAGAGHCLGMCGALSMNISFALPESQRRGWALIRWHMLVNSGRVASYTALGALVGAFGAVLKNNAPWLMKALIVLSSLILILLALQLLGRAAGLQKLEKLGQGLWRQVQPLTRKLLPLQSAWQALALGSLWGFLPCGLIYSALLLSAATGHAVAGALLMAVFGMMTALPVASSGIVAGRLSVLRSPAWRGGAALLSLGMALYIGWQAVTAGGHGSHHSGTAETPPVVSGEAHHHHH